MKLRIRLRTLARDDLVGIWAYSAHRWNEAQADKYLDQLDKGIQNLSSNLDLGAKRDYVREGYRVLFAGRHAIYYTASKSVITVVRVLHVAMDPDRHL